MQHFAHTNNNLAGITMDIYITIFHWCVFQSPECLESRTSAVEEDCIISSVFHIVSLQP